MQKISFPKDGQAHDHIIEWWYFNGHLEGENGKKYAFMDCLFRADAHRVKIPFLKIPLKTIYFSHSILTDVSAKKFYPKIDIISMVSADSFKRPLLYINYLDPIIVDGYVNKVIEETAPFQYHIKTEKFDLALTSRKQPFLEGGNGYLDLSGRKTYYYSLTNLQVEGKIEDKGKLVNVKGKAWMDHQWADSPYARDKWTWFSIQLKDDTEIICFEYGDLKKDFLAGIVHPNGKVEHLRELVLTPTARPWKSRRTSALYHLSWLIEIPSKKIKLKVEPLVKEQEMIFGNINYWEGPLSVTGSIAGKKVSGQGFLELVGRQARYNSLKFLKDTLQGKIKDFNFMRNNKKRG